MYARVLRQLRGCVQTGRYVVTLHGDEEMAADGLDVYDVERAVLTGEIVECQRDAESGETKYRVEGRSVSGREVSVVAKFGAAGKMVVITVYAM